MEVVIEFGYMILFAECLPIAPIMVLIFNNIEIRSDMFKLATVKKRPQFVRKRNIGIWYYIMQFLSLLSIFTNLLYSLTYRDLSGLKMGEHRLIDFFMLEHLVLVIFIVVKFAISNQAAWVKLFLERRDYRLKNKKFQLASLFGLK
jgi:hypothetical protein